MVTKLARGTVLVGLTTGGNRRASAVRAAESSRTIGVRHTLRRLRSAGTRDAGFSRRTIRIRLTGARDNALLSDTLFSDRGVTVRIHVALNDGLAVSVEAAFARGTVRIHDALWRRHTEAELTHPIASAICIGAAVAGGKGNAKSRDASKESRTVIVGLASVGHLANPIVAHLIGSGQSSSSMQTKGGTQRFAVHSHAGGHSAAVLHNVGTQFLRSQRSPI